MCCAMKKTDEIVSMAVSGCQFDSRRRKQLNRQRAKNVRPKMVGSAGDPERKGQKRARLLNREGGKDTTIRNLGTRATYLMPPQDDEIGSPCSVAPEGSHFLRLGLTGALVADLGTIGGDDRVDKFVHPEAHTGLQLLNAALNDRNERGRAVWIE